jgi:hypothetical protein
VISRTVFFEREVTVNKCNQTKSRHPNKGLLKSEQKNAAQNIMTVVYLMRDNKLAKKRFSKLYASAVFLSEVSHGEKSMSQEQLAEYADILDVSEQVLLTKTSSTKARHAIFTEVLKTHAMALGPTLFAAPAPESVPGVVSKECKRPLQKDVQKRPLDEESNMASLLG